jgi:hypothetical protein
MKSVCLLFQIVFVLGFAATLSADSKQIVGVIENARILPGDIVIPAKLDTGADNSSLNVRQLTEFEREGGRWVRFEVTDRDGKTVTVERKLLRTAKIKRHQGSRQERPVVRMGICIGNYYKEVEVNLVDRSRFTYQLLIGRSFMKGGLVVDPSVEHTIEPECRREKPSFE